MSFKVHHAPFQGQIIDILTKPSSKLVRFTTLRDKLSVLGSHQPP